MEASEEAELCFPQLLNASCVRPTRRHYEALLSYILVVSISLLTTILNLLVIVSISHFKYTNVSPKLVEQFSKTVFFILKCTGYFSYCCSSSRQLHTSTNLLLLSLAVSDFFVGPLLLFQIMFVDGCWLLGDLLCSLCQYVAYVLSSVSVGTMVLISIDRYVAVCRPLHYSSEITLTRVQACVRLSWICSVVFQSLVLMDNLHQPGRFNSCVGECVIVVNYVAGVADVIVSFVAPITVIVVLYIRVFVVAVTQARALRSHIAAVSLQHSVRVTAVRSELKAARTLGVVIAVFLMCLCPYYCVALTGQDNLIIASSVLYTFVTNLYSFHSCLNPIIYAFFYPWFRKSINIIVTLKVLQPESGDANVL